MPTERSTPQRARRALLALVGDGDALPGTQSYDTAREVGRRAVDAGFRIASGGREGVMEAVFRGAHESGRYRDGDTVAILPGADPSFANRWADIVVATGLGHLRNGLVANADVVVAIGGGAGTLSEIAFAWMLGAPIIALVLPGWSGELAGRRVDGKIRYPELPDDVVHAARDAEETVSLARSLVARYAPCRLAMSKGAAT